MVKLDNVLITEKMTVHGDEMIIQPDDKLEWLNYEVSGINKLTIAFTFDFEHWLLEQGRN